MSIEQNRNTAVKFYERMLRECKIVCVKGLYKSTSVLAY